MALPDDLSPDRDSRGEHPRRFVHGYHLLVVLHGLWKSSNGRRSPPPLPLLGAALPEVLTQVLGNVQARVSRCSYPQAIPAPSSRPRLPTIADGLRAIERAYRQALEPAPATEFSYIVHPRKTAAEHDLELE